jgi:anti-sigma B factor antagonist
MSTDQFILSVRDGDQSAVITASGDIDMANVGQLQEAIACAQLRCRALTLDLTAVTYCDSSTVRVLFDVAGTTALTIVISAAGPLQKLLSISGLDRITKVATVGQPPDQRQEREER